MWDIDYQRWSDIDFKKKYHSGICDEDFTVFDTNMVWVFDSICDYDPIWIYIPCKLLHTYVTSRSINQGPP